MVVSGASGMFSSRSTNRFQYTQGWYGHRRVFVISKISQRDQRIDLSFPSTLTEPPDRSTAPEKNLESGDCLIPCGAAWPPSPRSDYLDCRRRFNPHEQQDDITLIVARCLVFDEQGHVLKRQKTILLIPLEEGPCTPKRSGGVAHRAIIREHGWGGVLFGFCKKSRDLVERGSGWHSISRYYPGDFLA